VEGRGCCGGFGWLGQCAHSAVEDGYDGRGGDGLFVAVDDAADHRMVSPGGNSGRSDVGEGVGKCDREVAADASPEGESESRL